MAEARRYTFGPLERRGLLLGLRGGQVIVIAVGLITALVLFTTIHASGVAIGVAALLLTITATLTFVPVAGRGCDEWLPVLMRWGRMRGTRNWRSGAARRGQPASVSRLTGAVTMADEQPHWPPTLRGLSILSAPIGGGQLGVIKDRAQNSMAAVISVAGVSFPLLDHGRRQRLLNQWGSALSSVAHHGGLMRCVQILFRSALEDPDAMVRFVQSNAVTDQRTSRLFDSYRTLLDGAAPVTQAQQVYLVLAINLGRAQRAIRLAGGGDRGAAAVLVREVETFQRQLDQAGLQAVGALTPRAIAHVIRTAFEPGAAVHLSRRSGIDPDRSGVAVSAAGPQTARTKWRHYITDGDAHHATYWISEWPRVEVQGDWLLPLLLGSSVEMAFSIVMRPVDPQRAERDIAVAQTQIQSDEQLRARAGFRTSTRRDREAESLDRRERELADGHAEFRWSGYITVTAPNEVELENACGEVEQSARNCSLDVRRLDGEHDLGFTFTLPVARGAG